MSSHHPPTNLISEPTEIGIDYEYRLHVTFRLLMDLHGPAAVINYANEHGIRLDTCRCCGWSPHLNDDCILCDMPEPQEDYDPYENWS